MTTPRTRSLLLTTVLVAASAACGDSSDSGKGSAPGDDISTTTSLGIAGEATPADDIGPATSATTATAATVETTAADSTADDAPATTVTDRLPIRDETPLAAGAYRTTEVVGPLLAIDVDLPVDGLFALDEEGALSIAVDGSGVATLLTVVQLDNGSVLAPTVDSGLLVDRDYATSVSELAPPDILDWFAGRPGVVVGAVEDSELGGIASRRRTVSFGAFDGGLPCVPFDERICHWLVRSPVTGLAFLQFVGDTVVAHELTVAGHRLLVLIDTTNAPDTSTAIADSLQFGVVPHPAAPADSEPLPFAGPLRTDATYVHERSTGGVWIVEGDDLVEVRAGYLRDRFVLLTADDTLCMSFTDASQGFWYGVPAGPDGESDADGRKMDADIASLIETSSLEVVDGPIDVDLGGAAGVAYDVRPIGTDDVVLASTSITATAGAVTRVVAAPRADGGGADLAIVTLGSPCEALIDGLEFLPGAER